MNNYIENIEHTQLPLIERFAYYTQAAVHQGAFLSFQTLFDRFEKALGLSIGKRQKDRYRSGLKQLASSFNFQCFYTAGTRGRALFVTTIGKSHFNPYYDKKTAIADILLNALHNSQNSVIKVYETLKQKTKISQAVLERRVKEFKDKAKTLGLDFFKMGRELYVQLKYSKNNINRNKTYDNKTINNAPQNTDIVYYIKAKEKELLKNTASAKLRFSKSMGKKAWWLARQLGKSSNFYDNCKVKRSMPMLVKFAQWAIQSGFEDSLIQSIFKRALLQRHQDATDMGLNLQQPGLKFEMSSTVTLAKTYLLATNQKTFNERWYHLKENVFPKRKPQAPTQKIEKTFNNYSDAEILQAFVLQLED